MLAKKALYCGSHTCSSALAVFEMRFLLTLGCLWARIPQISTSRVARITDMSHWHMSHILKGEIIMDSPQGLPILPLSLHLKFWLH
jgi:hypothetical protein